jgi:hypothetical protein
MPEFEIFVALMEKNQWNFVSVVVEQGHYFEHELAEFLQFVDKSLTVCVATVQEIQASNKDTQASGVVESLVEYKEKGASVVVLIATGEVVEAVFTAVNRYNHQHHSSDVKFLWIVTSTWLCDYLHLDTSVHSQMANALYIEPGSKDNKITSVTFPYYWYYDCESADSIRGNPWFLDMWKQKHCGPSKRCGNVASSTRYGEGKHITEGWNVYDFQKALFTLAGVLQQLLDDDCYDAEHIPSCVNGDVLMEKLA